MSTKDRQRRRVEQIRAEPNPTQPSRTQQSRTEPNRDYIAIDRSVCEGLRPAPSASASSAQGPGFIIVAVCGGLGLSIRALAPARGGGETRTTTLLGDGDCGTVGHGARFVGGRGRPTAVLGGAAERSRFGGSFCRSVTCSPESR